MHPSPSIQQFTIGSEHSGLLEPAHVVSAPCHVPAQSASFTPSEQELFWQQAPVGGSGHGHTGRDADVDSNAFAGQ